MKVGIYGVGILGASIGYILRNKKWAKQVIGIGRNEEKLKQAKNLKAIDEYVMEIDERISNLDILILGVPVQIIPKLAKKCAPYLKEGCIITDIGSTKEYITAEIEKFLTDDLVFIGGHPMAGSEKVGATNLDPYIFENAMYVITRSKFCDEKSIDIIKDMIMALDANPLEMDPKQHDLAVATISHLPHIVASSLVNSAAEIDNNSNYILPLAAGGFRDTTRVASGSPEMWRDICLTNRDRILEVIDIFKGEIEKFRELIQVSNEENLESLFSKGRDVRNTLPKKRKGIISPMTEIIAFVPDKPGVIGDIANILGRENINIKDIEVLHVRENEGGSVRIGIDYTKNIKKIEKLLNENGIEVKILE